MREIKFRAWDKVNMNYSPTMGTIEFCKWIDFNSIGTVLMQDTGLKDKNGVEIYEEDIIVGQFGYKEVVKIEEFNFITREDSCAGYGFNLDSCNLDDIKKYCEIIGNIYENPELLDKD